MILQRTTCGLIQMAKVTRKRGLASRSAMTTKYDAHHNVLNKTYGALADLRRELSDSKAAVAERTDLLNILANCLDSQRSWLLLEDYLEKLSLARKDFPLENWWPRMLELQGSDRLEAIAMLFLRSNRPLPTELVQYANFEKLSQLEQEEKERAFIGQIENWLLPPTPLHLDSPRAGLRVVCHIDNIENPGSLHFLKVQFGLFRPRTGEKLRTLGEVIDLTSRSSHEQELFPPSDWDLIQWLAETYPEADRDQESLSLSGLELLQWLARWGQTRRFELGHEAGWLHFYGEVAELKPHLERIDSVLHLTHQLQLPEGPAIPLSQVRFFHGTPPLALVEKRFYLLRNPPPASIAGDWAAHPRLAIQKLTRRLLTHLRKNGERDHPDWKELCIAHEAVPQFVFELNEDTVRLRLLARSETDRSIWQWNGHEWQNTRSQKPPQGMPEILDDPRLEKAAIWLRRLDWFTPEAGLWIGDASESFLSALASVWNERPAEAEFLGNPAFQQLFLSPRKLRPRLVLESSGIDWFSVSAEWEAEGLRLSRADLERLQSATGRYVHLPDGGWMELDLEAVQAAHETFADLGVDGLAPVPQRVELTALARSNSEVLDNFSSTPAIKELRERLSTFSGLPSVEIPPTVEAELRPYQKEGFNFLCHLAELRMGGVLADDMGLGKTLQTLTWLEWLQRKNGARRKPALVICPASVLHNWRREANRFLPQFKVLVLESGAARHNLRQQIPQHDLIVTNYSLLRRDLAALQKFDFHLIVLDEAQFIKNPGAQVTQCVKQLKSALKLALTGTPLENRLLDLWSIVDFVAPGYLGSQNDFLQKYEPKGEDAAWSQKIARRRLSARLRPLMLRRLKQQVAKDLPDRIEERRDCELQPEQRKLYLAELRRSRQQILQSIEERGLARSKLHVLAALTRLRQICCHPRLVGDDTASGKTETLFELLEPLLAEGQKVLVFSQFVQMLRLLEQECNQRQIPTHILIGETKMRQEVVNAFQSDPNASVFLLSLRAAGTGLNLTTASYVVLYDPWWNPAVEAQAIDRSHRIGQTQTVNAYRLITPGTVEEKIWELQQRKAKTIADVLGEEGFARSLSKSDLEFLFAEE
jgi:superfamily II DNA or RNA helicase